VTLPAHQARLAGFRRSLLALASRADAFRAAHPVRLVHEQDMRTGRYLVRAGLAHPVPADIVECAATMLRELRSALDDVATLAAGAPVRFPIFESLPLFAQRARKAISGMPDSAQAEIEALQPYHAIGGYRNGSLWILDQLAGHPDLRLAAGALREGAEMGVNTRRKVELVGDPEIAFGAVEAGAVVASQQFRIVGPDPKLDMYFRGDFAMAFAADGPAHGRELRELLGQLAGDVEEATSRVLGQTIPDA